MTPKASFRAPRTPRRVLVGALAASLALHVALLEWSAPLATREDAPVPLAVALTELPPPQAIVEPSAPPHATKPKRETSRPKRRPSPALAAIESPTAPVATEDAIADVPPAVAAPPPPEPPAAEVLAQAPVQATQESAPMRELPPRVDLAYRGFLGTHGFYIGDAVYRLEHADNRYRISTVGEARGIASLFFHGQGRIESRGTITRDGLQPYRYSIARNDKAEPEVATFDWESGILTLKDDKSEALEGPTFDPMTALWQFYFAPPAGDRAEFAIATTRKLYHYRFRRVATENVTLPFGEVAADVWQREDDDGGIDARVWLAPSLRNVAVKVRVSNSRGTVEALLDSIRADEPVAIR